MPNLKKKKLSKLPHSYTWEASPQWITSCLALSTQLRYLWERLACLLPTRFSHDGTFENTLEVSPVLYLRKRLEQPST